MARGAPWRAQVHLRDNLDVLREIPDASIDLIYIDPPFNTGQRRTAARERAVRDATATRVGFGGRRYRTTRGPTRAFADAREDYLGFLAPRLREAHRVLARHGTLYVHLDPREAHYVKVCLDGIFGRAAFLNEVIWAWDYGGRGRDRWPRKHDDILVYVKRPGAHRFRWDAITRIPYLAPGLVTSAKAARGKVPTDTWWHTIVPTGGRERTGYPTQKPLGILRRIIEASSAPGDLVCDFFAGSGTTGVAALEAGRRCLLVDDNPEAIAVMRERLAGFAGVRWVPAPRARRAARAVRSRASR